MFECEFGATLKEIDEHLATVSKASLCHLDLHSKNVVKSKERFYIVDWEYAMMSHPFLVLASMASIERWNDAEMLRLLQEYKQESSQNDYYLLYLYRVAIDLFWAALNEVQSHISPIDNPYGTWSKLFEQAARERIRSSNYKKAIQSLEGM